MNKLIVLLSFLFCCSVMADEQIVPIIRRSDMASLKTNFIQAVYNRYPARKIARWMDNLEYPPDYQDWTNAERKTWFKAYASKTNRTWAVKLWKDGRFNWEYIPNTNITGVGWGFWRSNFEDKSKIMPFIQAVTNSGGKIARIPGGTTLKEGLKDKFNIRIKE